MKDHNDWPLVMLPWICYDHDLCKYGWPRYDFNLIFLIYVRMGQMFTNYGETYGRRTDIEGVLYLLSESTSCDISPHGFHKDCFFWRIGSLNTYQPEFIALTSHGLHSGFNVCDRWIWMWIAISDFNVPMSSWIARRYPVMVAIIIENEPVLNNLTFFSLQYDCTHRCSVCLLHMLVLVSSTTAHTKMLGFWIFVTSWLIRPSSTMI